MKAIERLYQYFELKDIKPTRFEKDFNISNGYFGTQLKRNADIGSGIIEIIVNNCRDLNIQWLITGEGNMLKDDIIHNNSVNDNSSIYGNNNNDLFQYTLSKIKDLEQKLEYEKQILEMLKNKK